MQAQVLLEEKEVVIRFPKDLMSQEALSKVLDFIELSSVTQNGLLETEQSIHLKKEDMQVFFQALGNPPKANKALREAAKLHQQLFSNA